MLAFGLIVRTDLERRSAAHLRFRSCRSAFGFSEVVAYVREWRSRRT